MKKENISTLILGLLIVANFFMGIIHDSIADKIESFYMGLLLSVFLVGSELEHAIKNIKISSSTTITKVFKDRTVVESLLDGQLISEQTYLHAAQL